MDVNASCNKNYEFSQIIFISEALDANLDSAIIRINILGEFIYQLKISTANTLTKHMLQFVY